MADQVVIDKGSNISIGQCQAAANKAEAAAMNIIQVTNEANEAANKASQNANQAASVLGGATTALYESTGAGIISGFDATISGSTINIKAGTAHMVTGYRETSADTTITPNIADATNPRIDLIYLSSAGVVSCLAGVAAASPAIPSVPDGALGLWGVDVGKDGTIVLTDLRGFKARYQNLKSLSLLDFGIIGDGITDNTVAIQKAIDYCAKYKISLYVPTGTYMINNFGLTIDSSVEIFGPPLQRLRGEWHYTYSGHSTGNNAAFKFIDPYTNVTMLKCIGKSSDGASIHDLMLIGNDCICTTGAGTTPGTYDDTITFSGNTNGIDVQNFEHSSINDCLIVGFSGVGLLTGLWQTHNRNDFANCNDSVIMGSTDSTLVDFYIHHSVHGIKIGTDSGDEAHMSRVLNARIEWMTGYGIKINYASDVKITGIIDRCTFAGIYAPGTYGHYAIDIDCDIRRCGTYYRGASLAAIGSNYDKASNICMIGAQYASIRGSHILSNSKDDGAGTMAPVIGIYAINTQYSSFNPVFVNDWSSCTEFLLLATGGLDYNDQNGRVINNNADTGYFKFDKANNALILADSSPSSGNFGQPGMYQYYTSQSSAINLSLWSYIPQNKVVEITCHIQAYTNYESVVKLAVLKSYKGTTMTYTTSTIYRIDTDNTILAIAATVNASTGVLTVSNSASGGVALYKCEISVPH